MRKSFLLLLVGGVAIGVGTVWMWFAATANYTPSPPQAVTPNPLSELDRQVTIATEDEAEILLPTHSPTQEVWEHKDIAEAPDPPAPVIGSQPAAILIDSIDLDSSVNPIHLDEDGYLDPDRNTIGWYVGSYLPNQAGPTVIAAHVSWAAYGPDKFARLSEVTPGQEVVIIDDDDYTFTYQVSNIYSINKADEAEAFFAETVYQASTSHSLWLVTCGGDLRGGSFEDNIFVRAELIDIASPSD